MTGTAAAGLSEQVRMSGASQEPELDESVQRRACVIFAQGTVSFAMQLPALSLPRAGCGDCKSSTKFSFLNTLLSRKYLASDLSVTVSTDWEIAIIQAEIS